MAKNEKKKSLTIKTGIFFTIILILLLISFGLLQQYLEKEEKLNVTYTAEATVRKFETQISRYLENSDLFKSILSSGYTIDEKQFSDLSGFMKKNKTVIEAYELAPDGIVSAVYPYEENKEAIGLNMLELPERKEDALLAKESGNYTIAGPFELKQGGIGALIFDPVYTEASGEKEFWGFAILVLNWNRFLEELQIDKLREAGYHFDVFKYDKSGNKITIMNCGHKISKKALQVSCSVPNDTWYFEIMPQGGWVSNYLLFIGLFLCFLIAFILAEGYWRTGMRYIHEAAYAKDIEKAAQEAKAANEAKTRFLFNMSHDIRTPMNAIIGYSDLLEDNLDKKEVALNYIQKIKASNSMLLSLINYILEMARIESGKVVLKKEPGNLQKFMEIMKAVSEPQISKKHLQAEWILNVKHSNIICDTTKLREIILNIVSNAIKYTPDEGRISLTIQEIGSENENSATYCFEVKDNGIGMSEDYLPHIFEEFSRERTSTESKVTGAGLGLPIVKALVEMMDGTIKVLSRPGEGSCFAVTLTFPIASVSEILPDKEPEKEAGRDLTGKRILLVEDNELNAEIAMEILRKQGLQAEHAEDGEICMKCLAEYPEQYYAAILMDIQMPKKNGYETTREIRTLPNKNATIPIIAMTANAFEEDKEKALHSGMNAHLSKPIDAKRLLKVLGTVIDN